MNEEERQSQVSALFDGELEDSQSALVVRRIMKDPQQTAAWSRYAVIGASLRGDPLALAAGGRGDLAARVRLALDAEPALAATTGGVPSAGSAWTRTAYKALWGTALAAGVAAASILVLRVQGGGVGGLQTGGVQIMAQTNPVPSAPASAPAAPVAGNGTARLVASTPAPAPSYTTPVALGTGGPAMSAPLVNYVVAHSEYLTPVMRFNPLSAAMMGSFEPGEELVEATEAEIGASRR
jgi:negative regulator of sigma E activity